MSNALTTTQQGNLVPLQEIEKAAEYIAKSGLFGAKTKDQACALMLVAQSEGVHYARAAMAYDVIQGRPALKSSEILSRFQNAGGTIKYIKSDNTECEVELTHPQGGSLTVKWDMKRAEYAGLSVRDTWKKFPNQMLRARAVSEGVRALFPACLNGFYATEEVQDFAEPEVAQTQTPPAAKQAKPKPPEAAEAEVVQPQTPLANPDYTVNIDGASRQQPKELPPEPGWLKPLQNWLKSIKDQKKVIGIIKNYCPTDKLATLGAQQVNSLSRDITEAIDDAYITDELLLALEESK
ncbi:MAG: hypothetical protein FWB90_00705 [Fibromonadales bacterium]|nr:hypothetical protein [Fibromonadales bacterium]